MEVLGINSVIHGTPTVATIGFFDGVHLGHKFLLDSVADEARRNGKKSVVVTFVHNPKKFFDCRYDIRQLTTTAEKTPKISSCGIDYCLLLDFDQQIATQTAKDFLAFLKHSFCLDTLFVGYDHTFGSDRIRDFDKIEAICNAMGIKAHKSEQFDLTGQTVSSSRIREYLHNGKILEANAMLGYKYSLKGIVMHGQMIGRTLGFPTANLKIISDKLLPHNGVYAVEVIIDGIRHKGMLNIGNRPTVDGVNHTVEVNIFDFDRDIYGKEIEVLFCRFVRDEFKFGSLEELKTQLNTDRQTISAFWGG